MRVHIIMRSKATSHHCCHWHCHCHCNHRYHHHIHGNVDAMHSTVHLDGVLLPSYFELCRLFGIADILIKRQNTFWQKHTKWLVLSHFVRMCNVHVCWFTCAHDCGSNDDDDIWHTVCTTWNRCATSRITHFLLHRQAVYGTGHANVFVKK